MHLLLLALIVLCYALGKIIYALYFSPLRRIPGPLLARITPLYDKVTRLVGLRTELCERNFKRYGDIYVVSPTCVSISNPSDCARVLGTHSFRKSAEYDKMVVSVPTTFSTRDPVLNKTRRHQIGPAFGHSRLREMEPLIQQHSVASLQRKWDSLIDASIGHEVEINYRTDFLLMAFDVIGALGYGQTFSALQNDDTRVVDWARATVQLAMYQAIFPPIAVWPFKYLISTQLNNIRQCTEFGQRTVMERKKDLESGGEKPRDVLQSFIDSEDPASRTRMSADQIAAENRTMLLAGTETSALTLTWTLHLLMLHPVLRQRAVDEIRSQFGPEQTITYAEAKACLPFTEACIYESLRLRPVSGQHFTRDVPAGGATFQGHDIPEGFTVGLNFAGHCKNPDIWPSPEKFLPERFLDDPRAKQNIITFSAGVRVCPGRNLAWVEMLTVLSNILKNYNFELTKDSLFHSDNIDPNTGEPAIMPRIHLVTAGPKYPERDCRVLVSKHLWT
ncbi:cytochrome P450 [Martensiomyces pterosporus]|nr:cytochrome P450 [Martensiomyces pterosporus]